MGSAPSIRKRAFTIFPDLTADSPNCSASLPSLATRARAGPTERQIDVLTRVRGALQTVGLALGGVLSWVVISRGTISNYAEVKQVRKQRACEMLDACLDRLADFYSRGGR
jgi:hypothetical protein